MEDDCQCNGGYTRDNGQACTACIPGTFKVGLGPAVCIDCPENTYSAASAQSQRKLCLSCPAQSTATDTVNTLVEQCLCDMGTYQNTPEGKSE